MYLTLNLREVLKIDSTSGWVVGVIGLLRFVFMLLMGLFDAFT